MAVPDHDDDIVEDYEVLPPSGPPAQGGPTKPPGEGDKSAPDAKLAGEQVTAQLKKGKISSGQARLIWIICIGVCVLGAAAVAVDYFVLRGGPGGSKGNTPANHVAGNAPVRRPPKDERELTPHEKNTAKFINEAKMYYNNMGRTKAWDQFELSQLRFQAAWKVARKIRGSDDPTGLDDAWLETIKEYHNAYYWLEVVKFVNRPKSTELPTDFETMDAGDYDNAFKNLTDEQLLDAEIQRYQAALSRSDRSTSGESGLKEFRSGPLKDDVTCGKVWEKRAADYTVERERLNKARQNPPVIDPADIEFASGPDYGPQDDTPGRKFRREQDQKNREEQKAAEGKPAGNEPEKPKD